MVRPTAGSRARSPQRRVLVSRDLVALAAVGGANFCALLVEITAGRLLAPAVGVSLETWTGIIGITLAGFALGDLAGGRLADRYPSFHLLTAILLLAAGAVLLMPPLTAWTVGILPGASLFVRVVAIGALVLLVPAALLGAVLPASARLILKAVDGSGQTVGVLGAVAASANVLGVALGGFYLLEWFGVRAILLGCGIGLGVLGLLPLLGGKEAAIAKTGRIAAHARNGVGVLTLLLPAAGGAGVMAVELTGARMAAPLFANSLYTWAAVIGVVLLGMSLGNAAGGRLADRQPTKDLAGTMFVLAGTGTLLALLMPYVYSRATPGLTARFMAMISPAVALPLLLAGMLLPAAFFFGTISPVVIRFALREVGAAGGLVGRVYAAQAVGSILGTFATGFGLIALLGARAVVLLVAEGAFLTGVLLVEPPVSRLRRVAARATTAVLFTATLGAAVTGQIPSPCQRESNYYCIRVLNRGAHVRVLGLDNLLHSFVHLDNPTILEYEYEQGFAMITADYVGPGRGGVPAPLRVLFIGGGGYVMPRYVHQVYPASVLDVVEIDPAVTETAYDLLGLPRNLPVRSWNEDGRQFFHRRPQQQYDLVLLDTFRDTYSVPYHLTTVEFSRMIADALVPGGLLATNIVDGRRGLFLRSYVRTLRQVFRSVVVLPAGREWRRGEQTTFVVAASQGTLNAQRIAAGRPPGVPAGTHIVALSPAELDEYLAGGPSMILTDDRAPVDNYLARVYAETVRRR